MRRVSQKYSESVPNFASDISDSRHSVYLREGVSNSSFEPRDVSLVDDASSFVEDDIEPDENEYLTRARTVSTEPFPEVPSAPLLTQQEEARLSQEIRGARETLTSALAEMPASIVVFMNALEAARSGNRLATDVLHAPIQGGINSADRDKPHDSHEAEATTTDAIRQAKLLAKLERAYAKWCRNTDEVDSDQARVLAARQKMIDAFRRVEPGFIILTEALEVCQHLEQIFNESEQHGIGSKTVSSQAKQNQLQAHYDSGPIDSIASALDAENKLDNRNIENRLQQIRQLMGVEPLEFHQHLQVAANAVKRYCMTREQIVKSNLRLAISIAREHQGRGVALEDLIQEAMIGLIRAADKFDDRLGCRFSTYACAWIRAATVKAFLNSARTVRLSANTQSKIFKINRLNQRLQRNLGREPTRQEITTASDLHEGEIDDLLLASQQAISLDTPLREVEGLTLESSIGNTWQFDPADWAYSIQLSDEISKLLETLSPRDALVVRLRFGIGGSEPLTLKRIGQLLGVSRERIRQLEVHALAHLRKHVNPNLQQVLTD